MEDFIQTITENQQNQSTFFNSLSTLINGVVQFINTTIDSVSAYFDENTYISFPPAVVLMIITALTFSVYYFIRGAR